MALWSRTPNILPYGRALAITVPRNIRGISQASLVII
jgi:hypothetical protein